MVVRAPEVESGLVIGFGPGDLERITILHNDALVIRVSHDYEKLLIKSKKYINMEETQKACIE